jgi:pimeloyl-ACP methyl ester carboxylesterase
MEAIRFALFFIYISFTFIKANDYRSFISNLNLNLEEIQVVTEDRYVNTIWALTSKDEFNRNGKSILIQHGLLDSSFTWLILEEKSIAKLLCDEGYKVYLPNMRGNQFSKSHLDYGTSLNSDYWDFSFDEMAQYDLPAIINLIKKRDGVEKIDYMGHSQGTLIYFLAYMTDPDYMEANINKFIAVGMVPNVNNAEHFLLDLAVIAKIDKLVPFKNFLTFPTELGQVLVPFCTGKAKNLCHTILRICFGGMEDTGRVDYNRLGKNIFMHQPGGTSLQNMRHWLQAFEKKKMTKFDFGAIKNLEHYGSIYPPRYRSTKMKNYKIKSMITVSDSDPFCNAIDTLEFFLKIDDQSVIEIINLKDYNHIDYLWADSAYEDLYPKFLEFLGR